jgi:O-antigen ligase
MPQRGRRTRADENPPDFFSWVTVCALAAATLSIFDRGGNTDRAIWVIAICAALSLAITLVRLFFARVELTLSTSTKSWLAALSLLSIFAILSALPVGIDTWAALPGHARFKAVLDSLASPAIAATILPLTMAADAGLRSVVLLLSCFSIAICATLLPEVMRFRLLVFFLVVALLQALLGVAQVAFRGASVFTIDYVGHVRAAGTFVNKNHLATLFALLVPFAALQASQSIASTKLRYDHRRLLWLIWTAITIAFVLACAATFSRSGIAAMLVVLIAAITIETMRASRRGTKRRRALGYGVGAIALLALLLSSSESFFAAIGDTAATGSFSARLQMYGASIAGAVALFPLGSGIGSFAVAFPAFQPETLSGYVEHAHNEPLQLVFEAGLVGLVALALISYAAYLAFREWHRATWNPTHGAYLLGSLGFALHANLDFPARIPALAVIAAILFSFACACRDEHATTAARDSTPANTQH